jgi:PAS domain S-box-containing protein
LRKLDILLIAVAALVTLALYSNSVSSTNSRAQEEFDRLTGNSVQALQGRMDTYLQSLSAAAAYIKASEEVTRVEFDDYVRTLRIDEFLPGISGIGFITPIRAGEEAAFLREVEALGETELTIRPNTDGPERFIIQRISPLEPNRQALGLDITFEEGRRSAAIAARETGEPRLTPRILLVQDATKQPGFLLLRPVYAGPGSGPEARETPFLGWVYAPFVGRDLLMNLSPNLGTAYEFAVYDGPEANADQVIYDSRTGAPRDASFGATYQINQFGREWTVRYASTPAFEAAFASYTPLIILGTGTLLSLMLLFSLRSQRIRSDALTELAALRSRQINAREEENRSLVENAVIAVLVLDEARQIRFVNQGAQDTFGYSAAEMKGMAFDALVTEGADEEGGYNATGQTKGGQTLTLDLQCNSWLNHEGEARVTAVVRDVTAEVEAIREMRQTRAIYDLALKGSRIGVFDVNLRDGTSEVSDTWLEIMGYDPGTRLENPQEAFLGRVHPDDLEALIASDTACIQGHAPRSVSEFRMLFADDEWRWMRSDAVVVARDCDQRALRLVGTQTDVTELRHSRNALEASETRFRQVVTAAPIGMALVTDNGRFLDVNEAFCDLCGFDRDTLAANVRLQDLMPREDLKKVYHGATSLIERKSNDVYRGEHRIRCRNGAERWGLFNISWSYDKNTKSNFYIAQINDITDQKELEQAKNEFVSTVSHELRTPLTSIKGALGLIHAAENSGLSAASKRLIDIARSNTDRLTMIVNDILDLEKISSGEVAFHFESTDLNDLVQGAVREMSPFAATHSNTIATDLPEEPIWVRADMGRTKQILANLMSNACKYSDEETEVTVKVERLDDCAIIYVQNRGPGIPEAFRPRLFQAFSQADSSDTRAKGGTGLGLNITKQIVTRQQGKIGFESIPNAFTVFWFTLPLSEGGTTQRDAPSQPKEAAERKLRVLHLEDDFDFAEVIRSGLETVAEVTHVGSLAAARKVLDQDAMDVVIIDWSLPDGDATALVEEILKENPKVRILGLSADSDIRRDKRLYANLVKSRTELETIAAYVSGTVARAS